MIYLWRNSKNFRVGVAMDLVGTSDKLIVSQDSRLTFAVDGTHPNDDSEKLNLGLEYGWREIFFARVGYGVVYDLTTIAYGAGLNFKIGNSNFIFDYALAPFSDLGNIHFFTIGLDF